MNAQDKSPSHLPEQAETVDGASEPPSHDSDPIFQPDDFGASPVPELESYAPLAAAAVMLFVGGIIYFPVDALTGSFLIIVSSIGLLLSLGIPVQQFLYRRRLKAIFEPEREEKDEEKDEENDVVLNTGDDASSTSQVETAEEPEKVEQRSW